MYIDSFEMENIISRKIRGSFLYMAIALSITFLTMYLAFDNVNLFNFILKNNFLILMAELVVGISFVTFSYKANANLLKILLLIYSFLTGLSISTLQLIYTNISMSYVVLGTIVLFVILATYGYTTKANMLNYRNFLVPAMITLLISTIINIFLRSSRVDMFVTFLGIIIFVVYIAYDVYVIKNNIINLAAQGQYELLDRVEIVGAFSLYLDTINLFIYLLRLFGRRRD